MKISILTLFPSLFDGFLTTSIIKRAIWTNSVEVNLIDIRSFTTNKHGRVDAPPIGGGAGLVMSIQPLVAALRSIDEGYKVLLSPRGTAFSQTKAASLVNINHLILICGHYEGVDERIANYIDEEISIGDFILTGGELGAMVISDAIIRLLPGVITSSSLEEESFSNGHLLEYPQFSEPRVFEGHEVPPILYSGNHKVIEQWRRKQSLLLTKNHRPDLLDIKKLSKNDLKLLEEGLQNKPSKAEAAAIEKANNSNQGKKRTS